MTANQKVIVVGGGIVGCMTAMALAKKGCQVTVVERNQIASQTSGESSWAGGGILFPLLPWDYTAPVNALTQYGAKTYPALSEQLHTETGIDPHCEQSGFLILPEIDLAKAQAWCAKYQVPAEIVNSADFSNLIPPSNNTLWLPTVSQIRPPYFMQALKAWLENHPQVTLLEQTALKPLHETDAIHSWQTEQGETLNADQFVVTSGAWSFELLKETAAKLNIKPMRGQILLFKPTQQLQQMVYQNGFYLIPRRDGYLLAGSTLEDVGFNHDVTQDKREEILAKAIKVLPSLQDEPIIKHWSGLRPGTPENLPTISAHPTIENLYLNTGHFRYGLTMAPASANMIADMMCGDTPDTAPAPYQCV